jgi:hypothetical protein
MQVFKLYGPWLDRNATDEQIQQIVMGLYRRGLEIAFEASALAATEVCRRVIEGFGHLAPRSRRVNANQGGPRDNELR